jgi:hypothetical protein
MVSTRKKNQLVVNLTTTTSPTHTNTTTAGNLPSASSTNQKKHVFSPEKPRANRLAPHQKKELVRDIQASPGGIYYFLSGDPAAIKQVVDNRPDLFPDKESRVQAAAFVRNLRRLHKQGHYDERVLKPLSINSPEVLLPPLRSYSSPLRLLLPIRTRRKYCS